ncbi:GmrSD restriction endonuclease domain-containing protein [Paraglaciecola sp.]|uniref:GmrSD restriction endonuclease domain-containing protein n=1 Tax=Paraglaciecola sp. TaxID=1920173 RepID=UPI003EF52060
MKATETRLFKFLQKSAQFIIPIYQRQYSWTHAQCEQLWKDIVHAGSTDLEAHFIGSVVYVERGLYSHSDVPQLLVIDGQQRLTSTTLLIAALTREIQNRVDEGNEGVVDGTNAKKLKKYYLCNDAEEGDLFYKLILTKADDEALRHLVDGKNIVDEESPLRVVQNFLLFKRKLENASTEQLNQVYLGLQKLIIVDIALDRERDNPQLIFESLNSTGLDLSQADLIRNYVLMGLEPKQQNQLYNDYWYPMESDFGHGEYSWLFNQFMRDFLTVKTGKPPRIGDVYEGFKKFATSNDSGIADIVADVYQYAKFYIAFVRELETEPKLLEAFKDINAYKVDVAYPLILELYHDYHFNILTIDEFEQCCRYIESYVFRRYICEIPTNSLNKTFAGFSKLLKKEKYLESFKAEFLKLTSYRRFPSNEEFKRNLTTKDMYNIRSKAYWLRRLENFGRKERVIVEDYTIEHVMPQNQNLSEEWKTELGENWKTIQETYLHTIGNLTLTGYNSELSDKPFKTKRDMEGGFSSSPLKLNQSLAHLENWNEQQIKVRTSALSNKMSEVWVYPEMEESILALYRTIEEHKTSYSIEDHPFIYKGNSKELYQKFRTQVLALDENVKEEFLKLYVAFKLDTNFVDVVPQASGLRLSLNCKFEDIHDPKGLCRDVTNLGRWGNGDVELKVTQVSELPYAIELIQQVIDLQ